MENCSLKTSSGVSYVLFEELNVCLFTMRAKEDTPSSYISLLNKISSGSSDQSDCTVPRTQFQEYKLDSSHQAGTCDIHNTVHNRQLQNKRCLESPL